MFEQVSAAEPRSPITEWCVRGGIGLAFVAFGSDKFSADSMWPQFFAQVGVGQWFRYFTGIVEILGGILTFLPWTAQFGLAILACTMACAALIWIYPLGQPGNSIVGAVFCFGLSAYWWSRRSRV